MLRNPKKPTRVRARLALLSVFCAGLAVTVSGCTPKYVIVDAEALCRSWRHGTVSKHDKLTQGTAEQIEGNNNARPAWGCVPGRNEAKS